MSVDVSPAETIPDHVPPELVVDFDFMRDPRLREDVHDGLRKLQAEAPPLFYTPRNGGHWIAIGREMLFNVSRDYEVFSNAPQTEDRAKLPRRIPITYDPPEHGAYRHVLMHAFAPKVVAAMEQKIRALAIQLIEDMAPDGHCDFVPAVAEPLPVKIFMEILGLPMERFAEFRVWVQQATGSYAPSERIGVLENVMEMTAPLVRARQETRQDDLMSRIIDADLDGRKPTFEEVQAFNLMLFIAGLDTVVNAMSFGVRHLARDPELQARLRAEPALIPKAMEELLRRYSIANPSRQVSRDTVYEGVELKKGELVMLATPAANLDPAAFDEPERIDLDRTEPHLAFGVGPHRCVGSHLARLELRILYEEMLARLPPFRADPDRRERVRPAVVFAVESLPLTWA